MEERADLGRTRMHTVSLMGKLSHVSALLFLGGLGGWEHTFDISFAVCIIRRVRVSVYAHDHHRYFQVRLSPRGGTATTLVLLAPRSFLKLDHCLAFQWGLCFSPHYLPLSPIHSTQLKGGSLEKGTSFRSFSKREPSYISMYAVATCELSGIL